MPTDLFFSYDYRLAQHASAALIRDIEAFYCACPEVKQHLVAALDSVAKTKKAKRNKAKIEHFELFEAANITLPPGFALELSPAEQLEEGRPTSNQLLIFVCISLCIGLYNGFGKKALAFLTSCRFVASFCTWHGLTLPSRSTLYDTQRALGPARCEAINALHRSYAAKLLAANGHKDEVEIVIADSTPVISASAEPCHEANAVRILARAEKAIVTIEETLGSAPAKNLSNEIKSFTGQLLMGASGSESAKARAAKGKDRAKKAAARRKAALKQSQRQWEKMMNRASISLNQRLETVMDKLGSDPKGKLNAAWNRANSSLMDCQNIVDAVADINQNGLSVAKEHDFLFSCSDADASFIVKSGRPTIFGYKAQVAMSPRGFIFAFTLPPGNNSDSKAYQPLLSAVTAALGKAPRIFIVDDGYSAATNLAFAKASGVAVPCFKGAKSKKLLGAAYDEAPQRENRNRRSAGEGGIARLKVDHNFGHATTFGHDAVTRELNFKTFVHNCQVLRNIIDPKFTLSHVGERHASAS